MSNNSVVPLKTDISCIEYDYSVFCKFLLDVLRFPPPNYLDNYRKKIHHYAMSQRTFKPKSFPEGYRVYIIDNRLNVLFTTLDTSGKVLGFSSKYIRNTESHEDYHYGDGTMYDFVDYKELKYHKKALGLFLASYGFLPIEELSMSSFAVFESDKLIKHRTLSQLQVQVLMEKFRRQNYVDWKSIVQQTSDHDVSQTLI